MWGVLQFLGAAFNDGAQFILGFFYGGLETFYFCLELLFFGDIIFFQPHPHPLFIDKIGLADADAG